MRVLLNVLHALRQLVLEVLSFTGRLNTGCGAPSTVVFHELRIGDLILFSGALRMLRRAFPRHKLVLAARDDVTPLAERCPWLDEVFPIRRHEILGFGRLRASTLRVIARRPVDLLVNNSAERNRGGDCFVRLLPARRKVGLDRLFSEPSRWERAARNMAYTKLIPSPGEFRFEMEHAIDLLEGLGVAVPEGETPWARLPPELWTTEADRRWAEEALSELPEGRTRVALFPSARFSLKLWPVERYAAVAREVADDRTSFVLMGGQVDAPTNALLRTILSAKGLTLCDLTGRTTLTQLVAALDACDIYLGSDTAALHIATVLGLGTVSPMAGGQPGRFYPWGDSKLHRAVAHRTDCWGCNWSCLHPTPECIMGISVDEVVSIFLEVRAALEAHGKRPQGKLYVDGAVKLSRP